MGQVFRLDEAVADVYGDLRLAAVLRRLLRHTGRLTGSVAGSVSLIDADRGCYVKVAEYGASCRLGHSFPLDEGATGRAFGSRRPVLIPDYGQLRAGHLSAAHPARNGPAAAVQRPTQPVQPKRPSASTRRSLISTAISGWPPCCGACCGTPAG